ncbi:MAG: [protein-PII] uridylyltransferase [Myxococcales bacterium]|nr:[protein-PII] uridylyltransferase [Myxococcales bacterium]
MAKPPRQADGRAHELTQRLRPVVQTLREELEARLTTSPPEQDDRALHGPDGVELGVEHARRLDAILTMLFDEASAATPVSDMALVAMGSYGRGAVALRSDADVRLLVRREDARAEALSETLLYPLWDAGVSVGLQVSTPSALLELAQKDLATATSLLDGRLLAGDAEIERDLGARAMAGLFSEGELPTFLGRLEEEVAGRHERFGGSVYLLEPDVKSGAGGLRDLDVARWAARARYRAGDLRAGGFWAELVRMGVLVPREAREIAAAEEFLWRVRNRLHAKAKRRVDRLTFDQQEAIAFELGYGAPGADDEGLARAAAAERMMQDYYIHARTVTRSREQILSRAMPPRRRGKPVEIDLGRGVRLFDGQVTLDPEALEREPALAFRVYDACLREGAPVLPFARDVVVRAAADPAFCERLRGSPEAAALFVELVTEVAEVRTRSGSMVRELHDTGLLLAMIPEFFPVTGRVHHDVYHVYTVDVHSVAAVDCLRALARGDLAADHPLASRLAAEIVRRRPLFLATLLHDVGKGYPDDTGSRKNHSIVGARMCETILPRLGLAADEVEEAVALVEQHLTMYHVATRRDLDDPNTIEDLARTLRGREGLRDLYLLTVTDLSTTSPTAMTSWKARMLEELYFACDSHLAGGKKPMADDARIERVKATVRALAETSREPSLSRDALDAYLASMPDRYLLASAPRSILSHAKLAMARGEGEIVCELFPSRHEGVAELCVVADDRPGLLAKIAAAITGSRLEVLTAQVHSRELSPTVDEAVDVFLVRDRSDDRAFAERLLPRLKRDLETLVSEGITPRDYLLERAGGRAPSRERPSPRVTTEVVVDDRASPRHTVIEVFAKDRPGLLHAVAQELYELGLGIALSKINTEGSRVADVFYVNERDGAKVAPGERFKEIRTRLKRAISEEAQ